MSQPPESHRFGEISRHTNLDECQDEVDNLRSAMDTRPVIDQAKGVLMTRHGCSPDEAFTMLRDASQRDNRKLRDIARGVVDSVQDSEDPPFAPA